MPEEKLRSADDVLADYHLAGAFRTDSVIHDPTGHLRQLREQVAAGFADRRWIRRRCLDARARITTRLSGSDDDQPWPDRVTNWLFGTGITTHVLLVAAMRNPTIRLRYAAVREVLEEYGQLDLHERLLDLLGCADLTPEQVTQHIRALGDTFDAAATVARTRFFFSTDITPEARPVVVDGSRELIHRGLHLEAMFWAVATFARCQKVLAADAPPVVRDQYAVSFAACLADLGIRSDVDLRERAARVLAFLPELDARTENIIGRHPLAV